MKPRATNAWVLALVGLMGGGALALLVASCATIMHGTTQQVSISSTPSSAKVLVDRVPTGDTPVICKLSRNSSHVVRLELDGYVPYEMTISKKVSGWVWGNLVFGGLIGLAVDAVSGGLYQLSPEQVQAEMKKQGVAGRPGGDELFVAVVLEPDPTWKPVGALQVVPRP